MYLKVLLTDAQLRALREIKYGANDSTAHNARTIECLIKQKVIQFGGSSNEIPQVWPTKLGELVLDYVDSDEYTAGRD